MVGEFFAFVDMGKDHDIFTCLRIEKRICWGQGEVAKVPVPNGAKVIMTDFVAILKIVKKTSRRVALAYMTQFVNVGWTVR